jgi:hypothetical protein
MSGGQSLVQQEGGLGAMHEAPVALGWGFHLGTVAVCALLGTLAVPALVLSLMVLAGTVGAALLRPPALVWAGLSVAWLIWLMYLGWLGGRIRDLERGFEARRWMAELAAAPVATREEQYLDPGDRALLLSTRCLRVELQSGSEKDIRAELRRWLLALRGVSAARQVALERFGLSFDRIDRALIERSRGIKPLNGLLHTFTRSMEEHLLEPPPTGYR